MTIVWGKNRLLLLPASSVGSSDQAVGLLLCCSFQFLEGWSFGAVAAISWSQARSTSCVIVSEVRTEATCKEKVSYHPVTGQWGGGSYFRPFLPLSLYTRTLSCHFPHQVNAPTGRSNKSQAKRPIIQHGCKCYERKNPLHTGCWDDVEGFLGEAFPSKLNVDIEAAGRQWRRWPGLQDLGHERTECQRGIQSVWVYVCLSGWLEIWVQECLSQGFLLL